MSLQQVEHTIQSHLQHIQLVHGIGQTADQPILQLQQYVVQEQPLLQQPSQTNLISLLKNSGFIPSFFTSINNK
jgi:hypothetical protein